MILNWNYQSTSLHFLFGSSFHTCSFESTHYNPYDSFFMFQSWIICYFDKIPCWIISIRSGSHRLVHYLSNSSSVLLIIFWSKDRIAYQRNSQKHVARMAIPELIFYSRRSALSKKKHSKWFIILLHIYHTTKHNHRKNGNNETRDEDNNFCILTMMY